MLAAIFLPPGGAVSIAEEKPASSAPATQPAVSQRRLRLWVEQLGSDDPQSRREALGQLMDLKTQDLPALRAAVMSNHQLLPEQVAAIRQAVTQVFLAGQPYRFATDPRQDIGFLGLQWPWDAPGQPPDGVLVWSRIPGFAAYRMLQPGDIIVKIIRQPAQPDIELHDFNQFTNLVKLNHAGEMLRLEILRYGRKMDVSIRLDHRPLQANNQDMAVMQQWLNARSQAAQDYWDHEFSPIDPAQATSSTQP
jgi:hypothetical protein